MHSVDDLIIDFRDANRGLTEYQGNSLNFDAVGTDFSTDLSLTYQAAKLKVALDTPILKGVKYGSSIKFFIYYSL